MTAPAKHDVSVVPVPVSGITTATAITVGEHHACALLSGGQIDCWGANANPGGDGELGYGTPQDGWEGDRSIPVQVSAISDATSVAAGDYGSCASLAGGQVDCWGDGDFGALGVPSDTPLDPTCAHICSTVPVGIPGVAGAIACLRQRRGRSPCAAACASVMRSERAATDAF